MVDNRISLARGIAAIALLTLASVASAFPYKCVASDGKVTYTDLACADAPTRQEITVVDNVSDSAEARRALSESRAEARRPLAPAAALTPAASATDAMALARTCPARRRDYELAVSMLKRDDALIARRHAVAFKACAGDIDRPPARIRSPGESDYRRSGLHRRAPRRAAAAAASAAVAAE